jgi:hypothetical protein
VSSQWQRPDPPSQRVRLLVLAVLALAALVVLVSLIGLLYTAPI